MSAAAGGGGAAGGGRGMHLDCISCDPSQTAEILLETITPAAETLDSGGGGGGGHERRRTPKPPPPQVLMPADASQHEIELARLFPLLNPVSACALISGVMREGGVTADGVDVGEVVRRAGQAITSEELAVGTTSDHPLWLS